jgi:hypothetical protein
LRRAALTKGAKLNFSAFLPLTALLIKPNPDFNNDPQNFELNLGFLPEVFVFST